MSKPIVAVVGRPNVGKSTFFNRIVGRRVAIVEDTPGVTRDRIYAEAEWNGVHFAIIDTGGIEPASQDIILSQMREQAQIAMDMANVILFMVDGKEGLTHADREVAVMLRRTGKKVILLVNKIDNPRNVPVDFYDFYELGIGEPVPISAATCSISETSSMRSWKAFQRRILTRKRRTSKLRSSESLMWGNPLWSTV